MGQQLLRGSIIESDPGQRRWAFLAKSGEAAANACLLSVAAQPSKIARGGWEVHRATRYECLIKHNTLVNRIAGK